MEFYVFIYKEFFCAFSNLNIFFMFLTFPHFAISFNDFFGKIFKRKTVLSLGLEESSHLDFSSFVLAFMIFISR